MAYTRAHTVTRFGGIRVLGILELREYRTGDLDEREIFLYKDQGGGRGITVTVASGVAIWLYYSRSLPGI